MDWTGGSRRRYTAPKGNGVLQKQKAHFARARANMQHTPSMRHDSQHFPGSTFGLNVPLQHHWPSDDFARGRTSRYQRYHDVRVPTQPIGIEVSGSARDVSVGSNADITIDNRSREGSRGEEMSAVEEDWEQAGSHPKQSITADQEELSLLLNRRKLLARSDWLGLAPTKPLRMHFPAVSDRDQVGRRRKIQKTSQRRARSVRPRLLTPIFEERLKPKDHFMNGALPVEQDPDLRINIGTDAFASQSGLSRNSNTPANLSVRQPSIGFGSLSGESMLLGDDGDTFDADQVAIPAAMLSNRVNVPQDIDSMYPYPGSQLTVLPTRRDEDATTRTGDPSDHETESSSFPKDQHQNESVADRESQTSANSQYQELQADSHEFGKTQPSGWTHESAIELSSDSDSEPSARLEESELDLQVKERVAESSRSVDHMSTTSSKVQLAWMQWLGVQQGHSSDESRAALVSSSEHLTNSEDFPRANVKPTGASVHMQYEAEPVSTPKGAGTQASILHHHSHQSEDKAQTSRSCSQSPSASLAQICNLARQPGPVVVPPRENYIDNDDRDALWRQFIIGSQTSEADESLPPCPILYRHEDTVNLARRTPSPDVSGLGTSDRATQGSSLFVTDGPSPGSRSTSHLGHAESPSVMPSTASGAGLKRYGCMKVERDAIEDNHSTRRGPPKPNNIYGCPLLPPNARRFKRSQKSLRLAKREDKGLSTQPTKGLRREQHSGKRSIYDLVDSDGASLA